MADNINLDLSDQMIMSDSAALSPKVRDEQIIRETILQTSAKVRDEQIIRETILQANASVHDEQIIREVIFSRSSIFSYAFSDQLVMSDALAFELAGSEIARSFSDTLTLSDAVVKALRSELSNTLSDALSLSDSVSTSLGGLIIPETLDVSDQMVMGDGLAYVVESWSILCGASKPFGNPYLKHG